MYNICSGQEVKFFLEKLGDKSSYNSILKFPAGFNSPLGGSLKSLAVVLSNHKNDRSDPMKNAMTYKGYVARVEFAGDARGVGFNGLSLKRTIGGQGYTLVRFLMRL
jgi:hypothetical protein